MIHYVMYAGLTVFMMSAVPFILYHGNNTMYALATQMSLERINKAHNYKGMSLAYHDRNGYF